MIHVFWGGSRYTKEQIRYIAPLWDGVRLYGVAVGWFFVGYIRRNTGRAREGA